MPRQDLFLESPWLNAPGTLGFSPPAAWPWDEPLGAFLTNPVSFKPRSPAEERGLASYPGGFLLHTGWPNPGFSSVLAHHARRWAASTAPIWVTLLAGQMHELNRMVRTLEETEGVLAVVLNLPPNAPDDELLSLIEAARGELPLVISVPLNLSGESWVGKLPRLGASAIHITAPRGTLPRPAGHAATGRLYGPSLLPLAVEALQRLKPLGLPVIVGCGVYSKESGQALRSAGAFGVALDAVLWQVRE